VDSTVKPNRPYRSGAAVRNGDPGHVTRGRPASTGGRADNPLLAEL